ncbi:hypothetical protein [Streptomyces eurocidicus]|uniref:Uncharacterized protein n=1 Tax=Streptomyces eurocidicus TaxID=66423 RepID=A0A7W8BAI0_STREU|nr:hypothetical protein [Streptomyces eurocidicus]MBB5119785.1 hypothetical protein [Streptomyces eurocidicus]MBF6050807.1 hypothetical protein [Streptomyces eurocidicus]
MIDPKARRADEERERREEAAVREWIERHVRESPPLSADQLRLMGEILGLRLTKKTSIRA